MATEINHLGHTYTYRHPAGWSGGDKHVREKLNESLPASEYPVKEAEGMAIRHALAGILAGGEAVAPESGRHILGGRREEEEQDVSASSPSARPDRILEESGEEGGSAGSAGNPDRILGESGEDDRSGNPDRILEG